ncbi:MAG: anhydro-N-acetylmuramic acid kinase [Geminicoccaceae bacterium]
MTKSPLLLLEELFQKENPVIAGLMSGTSMDGLDIALCRIARPSLFGEGGSGGGGWRIETLAARTAPMPDGVRPRIQRAMEGDLVEAARLDIELGRWFADETVALARESGLTVDLVGSHGQTIYHEHGRTTLQIGEPGFLANRLRCVVAHDFRRADVVLGGCGAPLVPIFDRLVLGRDHAAVLSVNIGGIANLTILPPLRDSNEEPLAFDCGPGNMVIDRIMERRTDGRALFDDGGQEAALGQVDEGLLAELMAHPFISATAPKSAGREQFGRDFTDGLIAKQAPASDEDWRDLLATVTAWTADCILAATGGQRIEHAYIAGGGARNATLMARLEQGLGKGVIIDLRETGIDPDNKEALAFALLARLLIDGEPGNVPRATGASASGLMGRLTFPTEFTLD